MPQETGKDKSGREIFMLKKIVRYCLWLLLAYIVIAMLFELSKNMR